MKYNPVDVARMFGYVREAQSQGQNRGARVEAIQHWALGQFGDSWCDEFAVGLVLDICFQGQSPFPRSTEDDASTVATLAYARAQGWITDSPVAGDLVFSVHPDGTPHHVAIFVQANADGTIRTIAGNTSEDGTSSNGDRVAEHDVSRDGKVFVSYPREAVT